MRRKTLLHCRCGGGGLPPIEARYRAVSDSHSVSDPEFYEHRFAHFDIVPLSISRRHRIRVELSGELRVGHSLSFGIRIGGRHRIRVELSGELRVGHSLSFGIGGRCCRNLDVDRP
jgi:hypothetical protein